MNRNIVAIILSLAIALVVAGCVGPQGIRGSGRLTEEERDVGAFTAVQLGSFGTVNIEIGDTEELVVEAEDNLIEFIETEVSGGTLDIGIAGGAVLVPKKPVNFHVTMKSLDTLVLSGSGEIEAPDVSAERLSVTISGSGQVDIDNLETDEIEAEVSGSGRVIIAGGTAKEQHIRIGGSGDYRAEELESDRADVDVGGSGRVTIRVEDELKVNVGGSGNVEYFGDPSVDENITGSGRVTKAGA